MIVIITSGELVEDEAEMWERMLARVKAELVREQADPFDLAEWYEEV